MAGESYHVGVDLGGTNIKFALVDGDGRLLERETVPTHAHEGHDAVLARMIEGVLRIAGSREGSVSSIGVGVPGVLDMAAGVTKYLPNLSGRWVDVAVGPRMHEATGLPTHLINDVRAFTVAEAELGAAKGTQTALCFAVGTGIGGGVVTHGRVHFGLGGAAGELGHQIVDPEGPRCGCGNRGCVESFASGPAIIGEANRRIVQGATTRMRDLIEEDLNRTTPAIVEQAAAQGDPVAIEVLERAGFYLGIGVASAIAALAPEVVVLGGGVVRPGGVYWRAMEETARACSHVTPIELIAFRPAALGYDAGVIGAALWGAKQVGART